MSLFLDLSFTACCFLFSFLIFTLVSAYVYIVTMLYTCYSWLNKAVLCRPTFCSNIIDELSLTLLSFIKGLCIISYKLSFEDYVLSHPFFPWYSHFSTTFAHALPTAVVSHYLHPIWLNEQMQCCHLQVPG